MFTNQVIVTGGNTMHVEVFSLKDTHPAVFDPVTRDEASTLAAGVPASLDKLPPELNRNRRSLLRAYATQQLHMYTWAAGETARHPRRAA